MNLTANFWRWLYGLLIALTILVYLFLIHVVWGAIQVVNRTVAMFFFAWLIQFFITPLVDRLNRRGLSRVQAVSVVFVLAGALAVAVLAITIPTAYTQGQRLVATLTQPRTYTTISSVTNGIEQMLVQRFHVSPSQIAGFTRDYSVRIVNGSFQAGPATQRLITAYVTPATIGSNASTLLGFLGALNGFLLDFLIVLILAFYMTLDGHRLLRDVLAYFPPPISEVIDGIHQIVNRKFGGYLRGQLLLALSYGLLTYVVVLLVGVPYPIFVAAIAAVSMLVPFIGTFLAIIPALIGFILAHAADRPFPLLGLLVLLLVLGAVQHVVINLMAPRVMSGAMGMHPLQVLAGLLLGAEIAGLWGAIFGVPIFGALMDSLDLIYQRVMRGRSGVTPPSGAAPSTPTGGPQGHQGPTRQSEGPPPEPEGGRAAKKNGDGPSTRPASCTAAPFGWCR